MRAMLVAALMVMPGLAMAAEPLSATQKALFAHCPAFDSGPAHGFLPIPQTGPYEHLCTIDIIVRLVTQDIPPRPGHDMTDYQEALLDIMNQSPDQDVVEAASRDLSYDAGRHSQGTDLIPAIVDGFWEARMIEAQEARGR